MSIETRLNPCFRKGFEPVFIVELLAPAVEYRAQMPGAVDNLAQSSISS